ncbi:glycosyltransferase [uncultured Ilyobacter sp.]|uniref:glycosyltransferase n=1 Tax=uncultured Ilyobacter sp. TaxID=544433 RepID=UPI0029F51B2A|nr:glycosyltransferase [uncultured Ilyobacter sp.]
MKNKLKFLLLLNIIILLTVVCYKIYLVKFEKNFQSKNIETITILENSKKYDKEFSFAVLGNIKNSINIFEKEIIPQINRDDEIDFMISTGNAVFDGAESKYRMFYKSISKLRVPVIVGIGENEISDEGAIRFYRHFGPFYFSFVVRDSYFIFMDTTEKLSKNEQREWLVKELKNASKYRHRFVFMSNPPFIIEENFLLSIGTDYIEDENYRKFLMDTLSKYSVTAVFSSGAGIYDKREINNVLYFICGGGGGGIILNEKNIHHYMKVQVRPNGVQYHVIKLEKPVDSRFYGILKNIFGYGYSLFYVNFLNLVLGLILLMIAITIAYLKASDGIDYYRDFESTSETFPIKEKLNIAMFTNDYFPFIGGVPISIKRLADSLRCRGHNVYIFAPEYPYGEEKDNRVVRCKLLVYHRTKKFDYPIVNIFSRDIEKKFSSIKFDLVHVHHPFWMGKKGLSLGEKYGLPVVLTYHTRFEEYAYHMPFFKLIFKNIIFHKVIKRFAQRCNLIFAPTNSAKEYLSNIGVSRNKVVMPTGVDISSYENLGENEIAEIRKKYGTENGFLLCSVSRLSKEKNIYFLLEGIKYIKENSNILFKVIIIGDGPERLKLEKTIKEKGLENIVELVGLVKSDQISKYYLASDIFIFSSKSETQGMVILEAMSAGCPPVAIRSSGIDDVIFDGKNGFKTKADIKEWSKKVISLMESPDKLENMSKNAYEFSRKFTKETLAERVEKEYQKAIKLQNIFLKNKADNSQKR